MRSHGLLYEIRSNRIKSEFIGLEINRHWFIRQKRVYRWNRYCYVPGLRLYVVKLSFFHLRFATLKPLIWKVVPRRAFKPSFFFFVFIMSCFSWTRVRMWYQINEINCIKFIPCHILYIFIRRDKNPILLSLRWEIMCTVLWQYTSNTHDNTQEWIKYKR